MSNYKVTAVPWEHGYELHIEGPEGFEGCTQSRSTKDMITMARDYIRLSSGEPPADIGITLLFNIREEPSA